MTSVNSKNLDVFAAKRFNESVSTPVANIYFTYGKASGWVNEASPNQANTSVASFNEIWQNMIGAKKVTGNNLRHGIPRFDWTANTVYTAYSHLSNSLDLKNSNTAFFVLTSDYRVYKCLSNNNSSNSTVKPAQLITTTHFQTSDGYIWKYMYSLTEEEKLRFVTPTHIPVKTITKDNGSLQWRVQDDAVDGAIHVIELTNSGSGYTSNDVVVVISGDGQDANAYAIVNTTSNTVSSIIVDNLGSGYTYANVSLFSSVGSGASGRAIISPTGGHGSDALRELGGSQIIMNMNLRGSENGILSTHNEFRQISLIEDPYVYGTSNVSSNTVVSMLTTVNLNGTSAEYVEDEYVYQGISIDNYTFKGFVVEWDSSNNIIKLSDTYGELSSDLLVGANSTAARFVSVVTPPGFRKFTGSLLYTDNILPIQRASDQNEDFKIVLNF